MTILISTLIFMLGTIIGSFISVVVNRLKTKNTILFSRSICLNCKKKLQFQNLIPVLSWLIQRGRCSYCKKTISFHYLALELFSGIVFLLTYLKFNFLEKTSPQNIIGSNSELFIYSINWQTLEIFIFHLIIFSLLITIFFYDLRKQVIPDRLSLPTIAAAIAGALIIGSPEPLEMLVGAIVIFLFFLLQFLLSRGTWIGSGDLRLGVLIGILLGWKLGIVALAIAYISGSLISIFLIKKGKATRKSTLPFAPFLVSGMIITMLYGNEILSFYTRTFLS